MIEGFVLIALKSIAVYVFIVAAIRLSEKQEFAQLSVVDSHFIDFRVSRETKWTKYRLKSYICQYLSCL